MEPMTASPCTLNPNNTATSSKVTVASRLLSGRINDEKERSRLIVIDKIDHLPEALIIEILSRLPVKDLLQFKSVCKSWYAIISSPKFISKHLNNYYNNKDNDSWRGCLLAYYRLSNAEIQFYELLVDECPRVLGYQPFNISSTMHNSLICGPCDGLYYVFCYNYSRRALWNPAINMLKSLPEISCADGLGSQITFCRKKGYDDGYGFGVDPLTGDYKVVVIRAYWPTSDDEEESDRHPLSVLVYSVRTNSWTYCGDLARFYFLETNKCYVYVNGCCYWIGLNHDCNPHAIISFDMATNSFKESGVPDYTEPSSKCLAVYDDSLALLSLHQTEKVLDIWTLKEGSWTKKLTLGPLPNIWNPIGHWKDNCILLENKGRELVLIDPNTQELKELDFKYERACQGVFAYMESLVSFEDNMNSGLLCEDAEAELD